MSKLSQLQSALNTSSGRAAVVADPTDLPAAGPKIPKASTANGRAGKEYIAAWLPGNFKKSIRLIQAKKVDQSMQDLMAEAFNDLFSKYNVPTVSE